MMLCRVFKVFMFCLLCLPLSGVADNLPNIDITENTNPKIAELYQQLQTVQDKISGINEERISALEDNAAAMKENEQRIENRTLTATTTAATGLGSMELMRGLAEQKADKESLADMTAYLSTFYCKYGNNKSVKAGSELIELPGGNDSQMTKLRNEYFSLAADLKERKQSLNMSPGLEAQEILDKADLGLYDDEFIGITDGVFASLYRAQMLDNEQDKQQIKADQKSAQNRITGGAIAAGAGVIGGVAGNIALNKDAPKERSKEINREYDKQMTDATEEQKQISQQLNQAIDENKKAVQKYNNELRQHKNQVAIIKQSSKECQELFADYVFEISNASLIENDTDSVPDTTFPDINEQQNLLNQCKCTEKGKVFDSKTGNCSCSSDTPIEKDGRCVSIGDSIEFDDTLLDMDEEISFDELPTEAQTRAMDINFDNDLLTEAESDEIDFDTETINNETATEENLDKKDDSEYCLPVYDKNGKQLSNGLKSINEETKIGDFCSSVYIATGEVFRRSDGTCSCAASSCNKGYRSQGGRCVIDKDQLPECPRREYTNVSNLEPDKEKNAALKFCETKTKVADICNDKNMSAENLKACKQKYANGCKVTGAIKNFGNVKGKVLCNATQYEKEVVKQQVAEKNQKYYNCCDGITPPNGISCKCIRDFNGVNVTPLQAQGLAKEYVLRKLNHKIKCKDKERVKTTTTRSNSTSIYAMGASSTTNTPMLQCAPADKSNTYYEFAFNSLHNGDAGFYAALCSMWGLKSGKSLCKKATSQQCAEISKAIDRNFYVGGSAALNGTDCVVNEHPVAKSGALAVFQDAITKEDLRTVNGIDPRRFYGKEFQVNANADLYKAIFNYIFVEKKSAFKTLVCGTSFVDNVNYYNGPRKQYEETRKKLAECRSSASKASLGTVAPTVTSGGGSIACQKKYPLNMQTGDILTCQYDGKPIDFMFKKLDARWNKKSTAGYQGFYCEIEGGTFTGKSCTLADKKACDDFIAKFKKLEPNTKGVEWDDELGCILKDARSVHRVQKVASTAANVTLTLASSIAGGPVVWALSAVEGAALVTEAVTEDKISDWAEKFLVDSAKCNNSSSCANSVLKKHIARVIEGSKQFNETQNKQIARQIEKLIKMLDENTITAIIDKGNAAGYIGEDRDPDLEKSIQTYYGTKLTSQENALLITKKAATVLTFVSLIGAGVTAGMRQAVKHNLLNISKARQAKWVDWKILKLEDVGADVAAMTKQGKKVATAATDEVVKTTPTPKPEAPKTTNAPKDIGALKDKASPTFDADLEYLNDGSTVRFYLKKNKLSDEEWKILRENLNKDGFDIIDAEDDVASFWVVKKSTKETTVPQPVKTKPTERPVHTPKPETPPTKEAQIRQKLGNDTIEDIKNGKAPDHMYDRSELSDEEWAILKEDLAKDGLELREQGTLHFMITKSQTKSTVPQPVKAKPVDQPKSTPNNTPKRTNAAPVRKTANTNTEKQLGKWKFTASKDNSLGVKYYEQVLDVVDMALARARNISNDFGQQVVVFERNNKYVIAVFDNADDLKKAQRTLGKRNLYTPATAKPVSVVSTANPVKPDINTIKKKVRSDFDEIINDIKDTNKKPSTFVIKKSTLSDTEWNILKQDLNKNGLEVIEDGKGNMVIRKHGSTTPITVNKTNEAEEKEWQALFEKLAPGNEDSMENFKGVFNNDLNRAKEAAKDIDNNTKNINLYQSQLNDANKKAGSLWSDFHKKYDTDDNSFAYATYSKLRQEAEAKGIYDKSKIPGLESWSRRQLRDADKIYEAQKDAAKIEAKLSMDGSYSKWNPEISKLKRELHDNNSVSVYDEFNQHVDGNSMLTQEETDNVLAYIQGRNYDEHALKNTFDKDPELLGISGRAKTNYQEFLEKRSDSVHKIDETAGLHSGSQSDFIDDIYKTDGKNIVAKNELIANFVSKRVSLYEDIITSNPNIYNRAKMWNQLSVDEKEKLCKEIFEIADDKLGIKHTEFGVKDLVAEFGKSERTEGLSVDGNVYLSSRHFPNKSFKDVVSTLAHEQAHKVDRIAPNKGILGSQLADLGKTEGYIQGYAGRAQADYRLELTEQSSWQITEAMNKMLDKLGL